MDAFSCRASVTTWQVAQLFGEAYNKAASINTAVSGFKSTGLWPLDFGIFTDADFVAASTTDIAAHATAESGTTTVDSGTTSTAAPAESELMAAESGTTTMDSGTTYTAQLIDCNY